MMEAAFKGGEGKGKCGENLLEGVIAEGFQDGINRSSSLLSGMVGWCDGAWQTSSAGASY